MQHLGDSGVIHERQRLTLGGEARDDVARELSGADDLDGNAAPDEADSSASYTTPMPPLPSS
jgi:hypothetical protein